MATINFATREISAKVVYFGASGAGSNTNLERLHALLDVKSKSSLHRFGPKESGERSLYFDYVSPDPGPVDTFRLALAVYSLPGSIELTAHRDEVMREVDGVVFVADARGDRNPTNVEALFALETLLGSLDLDISDLPVVIQVNHTDAQDARSIADAVFDLNPFGFPVQPAIARQDTGVVETHAEVVAAMSTRIGNALVGATPGLRVVAVHDPNRLSDAEVIRVHLDRIARRAAVTPDIDSVIEGPLPEDDHGETLPDAVIEVPFQPRELIGSHPVRILSAEVDGDRVRVELLMERMSGVGSRRLTVMLANRPTDSAPVPRSPPPPALPQDFGEGRVFDYLPDWEEESEEFTPEEIPPLDLPGLWYGVLGVVSGILIGLLGGYLVGVVG